MRLTPLIPVPLVIAAFVCGAASYSAARTLAVPSQYTTIQSAVNVAGSGDVIEVSPGEYRESVTFLVNSAGKTGVTLRGLDRNATVIRPPSGRGIFVPLSSNIKIVNLTVLGDLSHGNGLSDVYGGGIFADGSDAVEISNCTIRRNSAPHGGGIAFRNSSGIVINSLIEQNTAVDPATCQASGGGIFIYNDSRYPNKTLSLINNQFVDNASVTTVINPPDGPLSNNPGICMALGGGLFHQLTNRTVNINNPGIFDGGDSSFHVVISNNLFSGNTTSGAQHYGGALYFLNSTNSQVIITNNIMRENIGLDGGGIALIESNAAVLWNRFYRNRGRYGGGLYGWHMSSQIEGNVFLENTSKDIGCPAPPYTNCSGGGGMLFDASNGDSTHRFKDNLVAENTSDTWGGGIDLYNSTYEINGNKISGNTAIMGGGAIINNALGFPSNPTFSNNIVAENKALNTASLSGWGGGLGVGGSIDQAGIIANNLIYGNRADAAGGGITVYGNGRPVIINNTIHANQATRHFGGGVRVDSSSPIITNNIITGHTSSEGISAANSSVTNDHNNVWNNLTNYEFVTPGAGSLATDPLFANASSNDFRLRTLSPCVNAGNPSSSYIDPDGSRNDMGVYGGPLALPFVLPDKVAIFRSGSWILDRDGNGMWSGCGADGCYAYGLATDVPVSGDWNGDGTIEVGAKRGNSWYLDHDGNAAWSGCGVDRCFTFGLTADVPVVGNWGGFGSDKIGVFRNGAWYVDYNGNGVWDGCGATPDKDRCYAFGAASDVPVVGDWNGDGIKKIGVKRGTSWYLDYNGNGVWEGCAVDRCYTFGLVTDLSVVGDWNWDGHDKIGIFREGMWYVDFNGNGIWEGCTIDRCYTFGMSGDRPFNGRWR